MRAASINTIAQTTRRNGLNPEAYLTNVLTRIAEGDPINRIDALLPWRVTSGRPLVSEQTKQAEILVRVGGVEPPRD